MIKPAETTQRKVYKLDTSPPNDASLELLISYRRRLNRRPNIIEGEKIWHFRSETDEPSVRRRDLVTSLR
jgi:hypothetical protein